MIISYRKSEYIFSIVEVNMTKCSVVVIICGLILTIFLSGHSYADTTYYGIGLKSCGRFVRVYDYVNKTSKDAPAPIEATEYVVFLSWTYGFATAVSLYTKVDYFKMQDEDSTALWLVNYCKKHPLEKFITANMELLSKLSGK